MTKSSLITHGIFYAFLIGLAVCMFLIFFTEEEIYQIEFNELVIEDNKKYAEFVDHENEMYLRGEISSYQFDHWDYKLGEKYDVVSSGLDELIGCVYKSNDNQMCLYEY